MGKFREVTHVVAGKYGGNNGNASFSKSYCIESQSITSVSHAPDYRRLGDSSSDIGGPFFSLKLKWGGLPAKVSLQGDLSPSDFGWKSEGILVPSILESEMRAGAYGTPALLASLSPPPESESSQIASGATAISRVAPTSPVWDGATAVAELIGDGVPLKAPGSTANPGSEYLNLTFGYIPTASDILSLRNTVQNSEKILAQLERDSGKVIRRSYEFPELPLAGRGPYGGSDYPVFMGGGTPTAYEVGRGTWSLSYKQTRTRRFSGAFTYHLPPKGTWRRKVAELDHLYGVRPGIDTAWNAVPFSWLADYQSNAGDVLQNITAFAQDGLILKYGYITSVTEDVGTWTWTYPIRRNGDRNTWSTYSGSFQHSCRVLNRMPANPFGFGPTGVPLTGRQKANVAALGISLV